jgi:YidC/Oxa1 family membrane protein insertase
MKALRPYQAQIREKYKGNEQLQNRALGKLYEDAEQNPLAGCLFSLAQLPVFLGLYRGIRSLARDNELQEPFLFIPSLEGPVSPPNYQGLDWLVQGWTSVDGLPVPPLGWETTLAFLIMPVVLVVLQGITMQILQPPMDDSMGEEEKEQLQKTQLVFKFLPLLIGFFSLQVPAGLTIYWFTSNVFTLSQSLAVRAYFAANPPEIELPDYWDQALKGEEMSPEERRKASEAGLRVGPTLEELIDEAKFHSVIERQPLRIDSAAWQRVESSSTFWYIPPEMEAWVKEGKHQSTRSSSSSSNSRETPAQVEAAT